MVSYLKSRITQLNELRGTWGFGLLIGVVFTLVITFSLIVVDIFSESKAESNTIKKTWFRWSFVSPPEPLAALISRFDTTPTYDVEEGVLWKPKMKTIRPIHLGKELEISDETSLNSKPVMAVDASEHSDQLPSIKSSTKLDRKEYLVIDLTEPSNLDEEAINQFLEGTNLAGLGRAFKEAEKKYSVNAKYLMAHAIHESNWGRSKIAIEKNNLFGYKAYDRNPYGSAMRFNSLEESIDFTARFIANNYLREKGKYFNGPTLVGMNKYYATSKEWAQNIAKLMNRFDEKMIRG